MLDEDMKHFIGSEILYINGLAPCLAYKKPLTNVITIIIITKFKQESQIKDLFDK